MGTFEITKESSGFLVVAVIVAIVGLLDCIQGLQTALQELCESLRTRGYERHTSYSSALAEPECPGVQERSRLGVRTYANVNGHADGILEFHVDPTSLYPHDVIRNHDCPLRFHGWYRSREHANVWVVLEDRYGNCFLQNPPVRFSPRDGTWQVTNVLPGDGIVAVVFVEADERLHARFTQMVKQNAWGGFRDLPEKNYLDRIPIHRES